MIVQDQAQYVYDCAYLCMFVYDHAQSMHQSIHVGVHDLHIRDYA